MTKKKPTALLVDDDAMQGTILTAVLKKFGIFAVFTTTAKDFLSKLKTLKPDLCFVDLNIDELGIGFTIIKAIRNVLGPELPIIVLSGQSDRQAVTHAMEVGANDFIGKPIDREILASKLTRYLVTDELLVSQSNLFPVPEGGSPAQIELEFDLREVDEFGMKIVSRHLLNKGSVFQLESELIYEITGAAKPQLFTVASTWLEDNGEYAAFAEFDATNEELMAAVRRWLSKNSS